MVMPRATSQHVSYAYAQETGPEVFWYTIRNVPIKARTAKLFPVMMNVPIPAWRKNIMICPHNSNVRLPKLLIVHTDIMDPSMLVAETT